jgi:selenocysteine-specific elongation factor
VTVVVGTAGHIDHGKTTLLRALTGIDADRLPEERRRGMTIDIGYAHFALADGTELDFVDVPGHDRLVGNMLVGAGEIDAALLVVAADDGLRAQTHEHIDLLDALDVGYALVAITKADLVTGARTGEVCEAVATRLASTALAGAPIVVVSGTTGDGIEQLRAGLVGLRDRVLADPARVALSARPVRLAVDRAFRIKGRGTVVTGTLRGGPLARAASLRVVPGEAAVRVREIQVHGEPVEEVAGGGRTALNLAGEAAAGLHRGVVLTNDPDVHSSDRWLVMLAAAVPDRARFRVHLGTAAAEAVVGRSGRDALDLRDGASAAVLRLDAAMAAATGDRFVLRRATTSGPAVVGGAILDPLPARGVSRRRQTAERVAALAAAVQVGDLAAVQVARIELHGIVASERRMAPDVHDAASAAALDTVRAYHAARPGDAGPTLAAVRSAATRALRRHATVSAADGAARATTLVDELVSGARILRDGDRVRAPDHQPAAVDPEVAAAMDRLVEALTVLAPPPLRDAATAAGCPPAAIRELERTGRIVVLDDDLAYAMPIYRDLAATALALAAREPLAPATFRDATGTSRRYVVPILEDLDRRGILRRTAAGHVPGPRAPAGVRGGT